MPPVPTDIVPDRPVADIISMLNRCDVEHRGPFLDLGGDDHDARLAGSSRGRDGGVSRTEHDGADWLVSERRTLTTSFVVGDATPVFASARVIPRGARSVTFELDGQSLGSVRFSPEAVRDGAAVIVRTPTTTLPIDAGAHELALRWNPRSNDEPYAEVDWVRLGVDDELEATFGAPVTSDLLDPAAALDKIPHRALSVRPPSLVRCPIRVPELGRLRLALGARGRGSAEVEIAIRADGEPRSVIQRKAVAADRDAWENLDVGLDAFAGRLVHLELSVPAGDHSTRVLIGDPTIAVQAAEPQKVKQAQVAVVVVFSGIDRDDIPSYTDRVGLDRLSKFAAKAAVFTNHRGPTTVAPSVIASLLTGLPPSGHTLDSLGARLPASIPTVLDAASTAGIHAAFFTSVPTSFAPYGFARPKGQRHELSPVSGDGVEAIGEATRFIEKTLGASPSARILVVIHARGGHPPWNVGDKQLASLPPPDYSGTIQPRRAAQQLALLRSRDGTARIGPGDFDRVRALHSVALAEQDRAFGRLIESLETLGVEDESLIIVTSDVSSGLSRLFADAPPLNEATLALPLLVKFPSLLLSHKTVSTPTEVYDVTSTLFETFAIPAPKWMTGRDLQELTSSYAPPRNQPLFAELDGRLSAREGGWVLELADNRPPRLCEIALDPTCTFDRTATRPLVGSALFRMVVEDETRPAPMATQESVEYDDTTAAALRVWGTLK